jgi:hypothetical protein
MRGRFSRATVTTTGATVFTASLIATGVGVITHDASLSAGGSAASFLSMAIAALPVVHGWITDTSAERQRLNDATAQQLASHAQHVAAQASIICDRDRLLRDSAAATARMEVVLAAEVERLRDEADDGRNRIIVETTESVLDLVHRGLLQPRAAEERSRVLQFPPRQSREQARGHGVRGS